MWVGLDISEAMLGKWILDKVYDNLQNTEK